MDPSVLLKMIADIALWFALAGTLLPECAASVSTPVALILAAICGTLGSLPHEKSRSLRFLALLPLALFAFIITSLDSALLYAPPALYTAFIIVMQRYSFSREQCASFFKYACIVLGAWLFMTIIFGGIKRVETTAGTYSICFAICSVALLRVLRQDESTRREPRFVLLCLLAPIAVAGAALLLSLPGVTSALGAVLRGLYEYIISPILMLFAYILVGFAYVLTKVFGEPKPLEPVENETEMGEIGFGDEMTEYLQSREPSDGADRAFLIFAVIVFLAIAFLVFRKMLGAKRTSDAAPSAGDVRGAADPYTPARKLASLFRPRTDAEIIRSYYARFLRRAENAGIELPAYYTSAMVARDTAQVFAPEALDGFRAIYIRARYGGTVTRADVKRAKAYLDELKYKAPNAE